MTLAQILHWRQPRKKIQTPLIFPTTRSPHQNTPNIKGPAHEPKGEKANSPSVWNFSYEPLSSDSTCIIQFLATWSLEELFNDYTQEVPINGGMTLTERTLHIVDLRATLVSAGWLVPLSNAANERILKDKQHWRQIKGRDNMRALLSYCYYNSEDAWLVMTFVAIARGLGYDISHRDKTPSSKLSNCQQDRSLYDGEMNNVGFLARESGQFGSSCLHDNYGDEGTGEERRFYDD